MDPREPVLASVAKRQAELVVEAGDIYVRAGEPLIVTRADSRIEWRTAAGDDAGEPKTGFIRRAVDLVPVDPATSSYEANVWQLASSTGIPRDVRALVVGRAARRAPNEVARTIVRRWATALAAGVEPRRS